ncbi:MAG TPA: hypothetical protein VIX63_07095 [Vicinamibacterales bacterium]
MAREPELQGQHREIVGLPKLHERRGETTLRQVSVQGDAFDAPE